MANYTIEDVEGGIKIKFPFNLKITGWIRQNIAPHQAMYEIREKCWIIRDLSKKRQVEELLESIYGPKEQTKKEKSYKSESNFSSGYYQNRHKGRQEKREYKQSGSGLGRGMTPEATFFLLPDAPWFLIQAVHRALVKEFHPDKNPDKREDATKLTQEINAAYDKLKKKHGK